MLRIMWNSVFSPFPPNECKQISKRKRVAALGKTKIDGDMAYIGRVRGSKHGKWASARKVPRRRHAVCAGQ